LSTPGQVNTGSGGGGGDTTQRESAGGSGIVIFTLPISATVEFSVGVTFQSSVSGGKTIYSVLATSTTSETVTIL
jgi:hypothetical protein